MRQRRNVLSETTSGRQMMKGISMWSSCRKEPCEGGAEPDHSYPYYGRKNESIVEKSNGAKLLTNQAQTRRLFVIHNS